MRKALVVAALIFAVGCQSVERRTVQVLPEDGDPRPYNELLERARLIASNADEAFYLDNWERLDQMASYLAQTGRLIARSPDVPPAKRPAVVSQGAKLEAEANKLREQGRLKQPDTVTPALTRVHVEVRQLHDLLRTP